MPRSEYRPDGGVSGPAGFTDSFSLKIAVADSNAVPTDASAFAIALAQSDTNAGQTEAVKLAFPAPDFGDTNVAPTESASAAVRVWQSGSTSVAAWTNPANANGQNDGTLAVGQTVLTGATTSQMNSSLATNLPFTSALFRGYFKFTTTLLTSVVQIVAHSTSALFADQTILTFSGLNGNIDHSTGDFTFDLQAAGINTSAKMNSLQIQWTTTDTVAGVTPAVFSVDAAAAELTGVF